MKKVFITIIASVALLATSCGNMGNLGGLGGTSTGTNGQGGLGDILSGVLGGLANANTAGSLIDFVIGKAPITQDQLVGRWGYAEPGCAFTSEKLLAQAGGAVAAGKVKEKLQPVYNNLGINVNNTYFVFSADNQFKAQLKNIPLGGTYTFDPSTSSIKFQTALFSQTGYVTRTTKGISITFESKKLLTLLQTLTALTGNSTLKTVGDLSSEFDGVRVGFNCSKQ